MIQALAAFFEAQDIALPKPIDLERPKQADMGDYALTCCFQLAGVFKKAPKAIAEELVERLNADTTLSSFASFEALNGFINIKLSDAFLWQAGKDFFTDGFNYPKKNTSVLLEYVSANPTGPLHIGHGRWAVLGQSLASLLAVAGYDVKTEFYINDAGNQIKTFRASVEAARAGEAIPEDGYHGTYIQDLADSDSDPLEAMLGAQKQILSQIHVNFDTWYSEKSLYANDKVEAGLKALKDRGVTYEEGGALWFRSTDFGDDKDRVMIKADGSYTYFAVDIAYHKDKLDRGFDQLVNIWGADHHGYVPRVNAAIQALGYDADKLKVMIGQLVSLKRGGEPVRMSKRTGEMITFDEVIDEIGADATLFYLIYRSPDTHLEFDLEVAKSQSTDNPVYYVQYAHARMCSILRKLELPLDLDVFNTSLHGLEPQERQLLLMVLKTKEMVLESAESYMPFRVASYVLDLARSFHHFYETCAIAKADAPLKDQRVALLYLTKKVLKETLALLGISSPEQM